ncbi:hypothetical protein Pla52o_35000 [Novipirellula galeiformis]|uniref:Uncharacterized protein n=1 Tax=Novipirellula galeiformis TaxID=2528004 RepID=A0A5C6CFX3_9BACT|nr:hypothetical protein [Novipirellula galeiformis]TWU22444.1 hypothetical protein Pla52o_35000 [Novipirellula galeiformis]
MKCKSCNIHFADNSEACPICGEPSGVIAIAKPPVPANPSHGPGTELKKMLGCECKLRVEKMDAWGVEGCRKNIDTIVGWLIAESANRNLPSGSVTKDAARSLVRIAIQNAEKNGPSGEDKISAVWVYWSGGADGDELKYSMRSVAKHFTGLDNIVLCGDREPWYSGDFIHSPKWTKAEAKRKYGTGKWAKWTDSIVKLQRIIDSPLVTDRFLWLYDDTFFMRDITLAEAAIHRRTRLLCAHPEAKANGTWREVLRRTTQALHESGRPSRNYSHHGPVVFDKQLLQQTIDKFDPLNRPRAIESLYINHHFDLDQTQQLGNWMRYTQKPSTRWKPDPNAAIVNVGSFRRSVATAMAERFPDASPVETAPELDFAI